MRGWSLKLVLHRVKHFICPAYAGMILVKIVTPFLKINLSRVCGDDPNNLYPIWIEYIFVPRMRGWSPFSSIKIPLSGICPAYAGMIPKNRYNKRHFDYLSRVCGDDPLGATSSTSAPRFVPRMRGWSLEIVKIKFFLNICPAYAGMILKNVTENLVKQNLSRVCGDDPYYGCFFHQQYIFVPRMRGWSCLDSTNTLILHICPAYAGMIPQAAITDTRGDNLSRVCGDDPVIISIVLLGVTFVPRMRGWSWLLFRLRCYPLICPAYAGMILVKF